MTALQSNPTVLPEPALVKAARTRRKRSDGRGGASLFAHGEPMLWLSGGSLAVCLVMVVGLIGLIVVEGASTFWPAKLVSVELRDGKKYMGEPVRRETYTLTSGMYFSLPDSMRDHLRPEFLKALKIEASDEAVATAALFEALSDGIKKQVTSSAVQALRDPQAYLDALDPSVRAAAEEMIKKPHALVDILLVLHPEAKIEVDRTLYRTGNFELMNEHFHWISDFAVKTSEEPQWGLVFERETNGRFYGVPVAFVQVRPWGKDDSVEKVKAQDAGAQVLVSLSQGKAHERKSIGDVKEGDEIAFVVLKIWDDREQAFGEFTARLGEAHARAAEKKQIEKHDIGALRREQESARLAVIEAKLAVRDAHGGVMPKDEASLKPVAEAEAEYQKAVANVRAKSKALTDRIAELDALNREYGLLVATADGKTKLIEMAEVVRAYPANQLGFGGKLAVYGSRWGEFFFDDPREANSEGGVFPAIYGTIVMTLIMSFAVVPFGVLAALYLREYAKPGPVVTAVRIAVNNLAGVPSIVFGVFGLGFFCYIIGKYIDGGPKHGLQLVPWGKGWWWLGLVAWIGIVAGAIIVGLKAASTKVRGQGSRQKMLGYAAVGLWLTGAVLGVVLVAYTPFFDGFFRAKLEDNKPTYGTGGLLWASLTLALLTLPVVIVATEEALAAVPRSMREGSYACGASKWQTIKRIVLPRAMPGIMTGTILAMARGAGEVAPLMLVGVVKLAHELPVDTMFPFIHPQRSFMHLGFHIYDVGFQSPNSKAAVPLVFTTTLLLILIIGALNIAAITLRTKLRKKFVSGHF